MRDLVSRCLSDQYERRLLIFDPDAFYLAYDYPNYLADTRFTIIWYDDIESFRYQYEREIKDSNDLLAIIVTDDSYVPYDIRQTFFEVRLSLNTVFPKLSKLVLQANVADLDIIGFAYCDLFEEKRSIEESEQFIKDQVFSKNNIKRYISHIKRELEERISLSNVKPINYKEWIEIARKKSTVELYAAKAGLTSDLLFVDDAFSSFILRDFSMLASQASIEAPVMLPKVLDFIAKDKVALIVVDGMSLFDFNVISRSFDGIDYKLLFSYALIPSTTAISRQSLLSGKYPRQLENPFSLSKEEKGFYEAAAERGYSKEQVAYVRGYDIHISNSTFPQ